MVSRSLQKLPRLGLWDRLSLIQSSAILCGAAQPLMRLSVLFAAELPSVSTRYLTALKDIPNSESQYPPLHSFVKPLLFHKRVLVSRFNGVTA
jgi:hypothetical protein